MVIGGLVSATFLTLFVLPTVYAFAFRRDDSQAPSDDSTPLELLKPTPEGNAP